MICQMSAGKDKKNGNSCLIRAGQLFLFIVLTVPHSLFASVKKLDHRNR